MNARVCAFDEQLCLLINMFILNLLGNSSFFSSFVRSVHAIVLCMVMYEVRQRRLWRWWRQRMERTKRFEFMAVHTWREIHTYAYTCDDNCCRRYWLIHYTRNRPECGRCRSHHLRFTVRYFIIIQFFVFFFRSFFAALLSRSHGRLNTRVLLSWASNER